MQGKDHGLPISFRQGKRHSAKAGYRRRPDNNSYDHSSKALEGNCRINATNQKYSRVVVHGQQAYFTLVPAKRCV
jgi:hypothetical protein